MLNLDHLCDLAGFFIGLLVVIAIVFGIGMYSCRNNPEYLKVWKSYIPVMVVIYVADICYIVFGG